MNHTLLRCCAALLLIGLGLFWHKPAEAAVSCSGSGMTVSDINFGNVNPLSGAVDITGTLSGYTCTNTGLDTNSGNSPQTFQLCFDLLGQNSTPRLMTDANGDTLQFDLYTDSARSIVWGNQSYGTPLMTAPFTLPSDSLPHTGPPLTIYGRVFGGQTSAQPGSYSDFFSAGQITFTFTARNGSSTPPSCQSTGTLVTTSASFTAKANVTALCSVNAVTLDFGTPGLLTAAVPGTSSISVQCASGVAYNVGLDGGLHSGSNINARKMVLGANSVAYQLYRDPGRTQVWGNTVNTDTVSGTGTGSPQNLTVYGQVPAQPTPPAGTYTDTVVVSVTY